MKATAKTHRAVRAWLAAVFLCLSGTAFAGDATLSTIGVMTEWGYAGAQYNLGEMRGNGPAAMAHKHASARAWAAGGYGGLKVIAGVVLAYGLIRLGRSSGLWTFLLWAVAPAFCAIVLFALHGIVVNAINAKYYMPAYGYSLSDLVQAWVHIVLFTAISKFGISRKRGQQNNLNSTPKRNSLFARVGKLRYATKLSQPTKKEEHDGAIHAAYPRATIPDWPHAAQGLQHLLRGNDSWLLLVSITQALLWLGLHEGLIKNGLWPADSMPWRFCLFTAIFTGPTLLLLALEPMRRSRAFTLILGFTALAAGLGYYAGSQVAPPPYDEFHTVALLFAILLAVASFKALMYAQHFAGDEPFSYSALFRRSWRNFLVFALALLFTGVFRGILHLWQALFAAIGIDFFRELFERSWFINPALFIAFGAGVIIFRRQSGIIDALANIQQSLMRLLLPLLAALSLSFILALPFTGLAPLWESGGSFILLWMLLLTLFFVNAVYKDDPSLEVYPRWMHRLVYAGVALLPIYSAIVCYGLSLRVMQYGWTVDRCLAFLLWSVLTLFALSYCYAILRRGDGWLRYKDWLNVRLGLAVLAAALLANSPLLDFRKLAVASQMARLQADGWRAGDPFSLEINYLSRQGRPGALALQALRESIRGINPEIADEVIATLDGHRANAERSRERRRRDDWNVEREHAAQVARIMRGLGLEMEADASADADKRTDADADAAADASDARPRSLAEAVAGEVSGHGLDVLLESEFHLIPADMDGDGKPEQLLIHAAPSRRFRPLNYVVLYRDPSDGIWRAQPYIGTGGPNFDGANASTLPNLLQGNFTTAPQKWRQIQVGDITIKPYHRD